MEGIGRAVTDSSHLRFANPSLTLLSSPTHTPPQTRSAFSTAALAELDDPALPAPEFVVGAARPPPPLLELGPAIEAVKVRVASVRACERRGSNARCPIGQEEEGFLEKKNRRPPNPPPTHPLPQLLTRSKKLDETIEASFRLGTDPRRGDHAVRGALTLPHGTGAAARVAVFADGADADAALAAGADVVGGDDLIAALVDGGGAAIAFDRALATPALMPRVARAARVLGPRGLMPNPKLGTVVEGGALATAIGAARSGRVTFRADRGGVVAAPIGRASFDPSALTANYGALAAALLAARPRALKGGGWGGYVQSAALATTQGRGSVRLSLGAMAAAAASVRKGE